MTEKDKLSVKEELRYIGLQSAVCLVIMSPLIYLSFLCYPPHISQTISMVAILVLIPSSVMVAFGFRRYHRTNCTQFKASIFAAILNAIALTLMLLFQHYWGEP